MIQDALKIQRTYLINLKRRDGKLKFSTVELAKAGVDDFQLVEAVDAIEMELNSPKLSPNGAIGCTLSHRIALWDAVNRGYETIMICEDDIILFPDWENRFALFIKNLPSDWQIIWLGWDERAYQDNSPKFKALILNEGVRKPNDPVGSHCIVYRGKDVIKRAYEISTRLGHWDCEMSSLSRSVKAYLPIKPIFDQRRNITDIWIGHEKNYTNAWYANKK